MNPILLDTPLRRELMQHGLSETETDPNPVRQFAKWYKAAEEAGVPMPEAVALATVTPDGRPNARMVLLKGFDESGFVFFTNRHSPKGQELAQHPHAALVFWWVEMERQIRIEGPVAEVADTESDAYFATRLRGSQVSASVSPQSEVIPGRAVLEERRAAFEKDHEGRPVPRPAHWGGYRVRPATLEFWQGRNFRFHDRLRYRRQADGSWIIERLAP